MEQPQTETNQVCPHPEFTGAPKRLVVGEDPVDLGDPADASTADEFFRRIRARNPERYWEVLESHSVNQNIRRDELSHEVPLDETGVRTFRWEDDRPSSNNPRVIEYIGDRTAPTSARARVDVKAHRDWLEQQHR